MCFVHKHMQNADFGQILGRRASTKRHVIPSRPKVRFSQTWNEMKWNEMKFISSYSTNYKGFHGILFKKNHMFVEGSTEKRSL